jgi:tetratricopeptide (TPR) repeat protein
MTTTRLVRRCLGALCVAAGISAVSPAFAQHAGHGAPSVPRQTGPLAPELTGLGSLSYAITTSVPRAQQFFDQGLRLTYAFNHPEAIRAFQECARLDPRAAMCHWGEALARGPNINAALDAEAERAAADAIERAMALRTGASPRERSLIEALSPRYRLRPEGDRAALDLAYADAMRRLAAQHPDDPDISTLFAAALMETMPWDYWKKDRQPKPATREVIETLERVMARHPEHPGAHHYYIHIVEASDDPDRAVASADRLGGLMPSAGHIVHMPAHIYVRVGRYRDAAEVNERAIRADEDYIAQCQAQGLYPYSYYPHNIHFLWLAATMEGRSEAAIDAARKTAAKVPHHVAGRVPWTADFPVTPYLAYVRFGRWGDILTEPAPPAAAHYALALWHYGRGVAFAARRQLDRARAELAGIDGVIANEAFAKEIADSPFASNLQIARRLVAGEIAARDGRMDEAIGLMREAVRIQDDQPYNEPPHWHYPVRHSLGAVLIEAGRAPDAEQVYLDDLKWNRENGWALFGLVQALRAQQKHAEVQEAEARFRKAWARADVTLTSSRF